MAARLALWYAASAFGLVLCATAYLYWSTSATWDREFDKYLAHRIKLLEARPLEHVVEPPPDQAAHRPMDPPPAMPPTGGGPPPQAGDGPFDWHLRRPFGCPPGKEGPPLGALAGLDAYPEYSRIIDQRGVVVFASPAAEVLPPPGSGRLTTAIAGVDYRAPNGQWLRVLSRRSDGRTYQVAFDRTSEVELLGEYRRNIWLVLAPALAACAAVGVLIARRSLRPLGEIVATAQRIGPDRLSERIDTARLPAELTALAETFNQMLDRLQDSFVRLDRFSADIAHELRTPVHNLQNVAEVALTRSRSPGAYQEALTVCLESAGRLAELIDRLLFLARAEDPRRHLIREPIDVARELEVIRDFFEALAAEAQVELVVAAPDKVRFSVDRGLFQRAVGNLVKNALAHTPQGGRVAVAATSGPDGLEITVADTGCGIEATHLPHLFDRFYRSSVARTPGQGVGLGLAIVRTIAELHGGRVSIASTPGEGTVATLFFPSIGDDKMTNLSSIRHADVIAAG